MSLTVVSGTHVTRSGIKVRFLRCFLLVREECDKHEKSLRHFSIKSVTCPFLCLRPSESLNRFKCKFTVTTLHLDQVDWGLGSEERLRVSRSRRWTFVHPTVVIHEPGFVRRGPRVPRGRLHHGGRIPSMENSEWWTLISTTERMFDHYQESMLRLHTRRRSKPLDQTSVTSTIGNPLKKGWDRVNFKQIYGFIYIQDTRNFPTPLL